MGKVHSALAGRRKGSDTVSTVGIAVSFCSKDIASCVIGESPHRAAPLHIRQPAGIVILVAVRSGHTLAKVGKLPLVAAFGDKTCIQGVATGGAGGRVVFQTLGEEGLGALLHLMAAKPTLQGIAVGNGNLIEGPACS